MLGAGGLAVSGFVCVDFSAVVDWAVVVVVVVVVLSVVVFGCLVAGNGVGNGAKLNLEYNPTTTSCEQASIFSDDAVATKHSKSMNDTVTLSSFLQFEVVMFFRQLLFSAGKSFSILLMVHLIISSKLGASTSVILLVSLGNVTRRALLLTQCLGFMT